MNGQHQRVDIPAQARTANKGLLQKNTGRVSLLSRSSCPLADPIGQGTELIRPDGDQHIFHGNEKSLLSSFMKPWQCSRGWGNPGKKSVKLL